MKKLRKPIQEKEFKTLLNYINANSTMRENTKQNYFNLFTLLYYTGMRLNEVPQLTIEDLNIAIDKQELIIKAHKQHKERSIVLSKHSIKQLKKITRNQEPTYRVIKIKSNPYSTPSPISFIAKVNRVIQSVLGERYSSHSFRAGVITDLAVKGVNPKIIQNFIGHSSISTTMNYISPSSEDIRNALVR